MEDDILFGKWPCSNWDKTREVGLGIDVVQYGAIHSGIEAVAGLIEDTTAIVFAVGNEVESSLRKRTCSSPEIPQ